MDLDLANVTNLSRDSVHLWYCSFELNRPKLSEYLLLLSTDEKTKAEKFKFDVDRERYVISKGVLRILLGKYLNCSSKEIIFKYTSYGKPYLSTGNLKFNISHSSDMAAFAFVLDVDIGIDIEKVKDDFDLLDLAQNFFSKTEIASLQQQPREELSRAFFRCWTRKEAFIKAEGSGLSFPLDKFTVSLEKDCQADILQTDWDASEKDKWSLFSFVPKNNYLSAIAVRKKSLDVKQFVWADIT